MAGRDVADVRHEAEGGIHRVRAAHVPVSHNLCDYGRGCNGGTLLVAVDDGPVLRGAGPQPEPIDEARLRRRRQRAERLAKAAQV